MKPIYPFDSNGRPHTKRETRADSLGESSKTMKNAVAKAILANPSQVKQIESNWSAVKNKKMDKDDFWDFLVTLIRKVSKKVTGDSFIEPETLTSILGIVQNQLIDDLFQPNDR